MLRTILSVSAVALVALTVAVTLRGTSQAELAAGDPACVCGQCDAGCQCCSDPTVTCDDCQCLVCVCDGCDDLAATGSEPASCCAHGDASALASQTDAVAESTCCAGCDAGCDCCIEGSVLCEDCKCNQCACEFCALEADATS